MSGTVVGGFTYVYVYEFLASSVLVAVLVSLSNFESHNLIHCRPPSAVDDRALSRVGSLCGIGWGDAL